MEALGIGDFVRLDVSLPLNSHLLIFSFAKGSLVLKVPNSYHAFAFSADVIHEKETAVRNVYLLIEAIMLNTRFIAEILLLVTIYALLYHCTIRPGENFRSKSKSPKQMVHGVLCVLLGLLFIVILALSIRGIVEAVGELGMVIRLKRLLLNKFVVSYQALYFVASLEVLLTTVWLSVTARKHGVSKRVRQFFPIDRNPQLIAFRLVLLSSD